MARRLPAAAFVLVSGAAMARDTGVPACDSSLRDDEACISDHVPQAQRATFSQALEQSRGAIGQSASNPQTRAGLK